MTSDMVLLEDFLKAHPHYVVAHNCCSGMVEVYHIRMTEELTYGMIEQVGLHLCDMPALPIGCSSLFKTPSYLLQLLSARLAKKARMPFLLCCFSPLAIVFRKPLCSEAPWLITSTYPTVSWKS